MNHIQRTLNQLRNGRYESIEEVNSDIDLIKAHVDALTQQNQMLAKYIQDFAQFVTFYSDLSVDGWLDATEFKLSKNIYNKTQDENINEVVQKFNIPDEV